MSNDKYANYSKGKVTYGCNGSYKGTGHVGNTVEKDGCMASLLLMLSIPAGLIAWGVSYFI